MNVQLPPAVLLLFILLHSVTYNIYDDFCTLYSQWVGRNEVVVSSYRYPQIHTHTHAHTYMSTHT